MKKIDMKDLINYHDVVRIVESQRRNSPKMIKFVEDELKEKSLNKIREELRKLKNGMQRNDTTI